MGSPHRVLAATPTPASVAAPITAAAERHWWLRRLPDADVHVDTHGLRGASPVVTVPGVHHQRRLSFRQASLLVHSPPPPPPLRRPAVYTPVVFLCGLLKEVPPLSCFLWRSSFSPGVSAATFRWLRQMFCENVVTWQV